MNEDLSDPFSHLEPWNPTTHSFDADVTEYIPGRQLRFVERKDIIGTLFVSLAILFVSWLGGTLFGFVNIWVWSAIALTGTHFLVRWKSGAFESVWWTLSFRERTLSVRSGEEEFHYDLRNVTSVDVLLKTHEQWWSSGLSGAWRKHRYASYNAQILLSGVLKNSRLVLGQTGFVQKDPREVEYAGLCFAWMVAHQLDVPLQIEPTSHLEA